jgi:hypothetical protein
MGKWKIWVGLIVLFLSGVLIGGVATRMYVRYRISGVLAGKRPPIRDLFLRELTRELNLTEEQRQEMEQIASNAAEEFHTLHKKHRREAEDVLNRAVSEMKKYLSPEQQEELDKVRNRMRAWRGHRGHHPPPPGPLPLPDMRGPPPPPPPPPSTDAPPPSGSP